MVTVENSRGKFVYNNEKGYWLCVHGRCPGVFGSAANIIVPAFYGTALKEEAIEKGLATRDSFKVVDVKPKRAVATKGGKTPKVRSGFISISIT